MFFLAVVWKAVAWAPILWASTGLTALVGLGTRHLDAVPVFRRSEARKIDAIV